jgi:hypothetical protein
MLVSFWLQGGGFDQLILDSLYDDAAMRRAPYLTSANNYGGVNNNPFDPRSNVYSGMVQDPFSASNSVAPPPNVQMAAMAHQQAMMLQQQQQQQSFLQQQAMAAPLGSNPFGNPYAVNIPYGSSTQQYQNNPFGNPGLL